MTRAERKRLATEARRLAFEFAEGSGPRLENWTWCGCAIGHVMTRAGFSDISITLAEEIDSLLPDGCASEGWCDLTSHGLLSHATQDQVYGNHPGAVVFPLLALADVLEDGTDRGEQ